MQITRVLRLSLLSCTAATVMCKYSPASGRTVLPDGYTDTLETSKVSSDRDRSAASASPLLILNAKDISRQGAMHLHEAVKNLAGVSVTDYGGIGGLKTVSVRNLGAAHTTVSYDGFIISDAQNGQTDISRFGLENVSRISIGIGPSDEIFRSARLMGTGGSVLSVETDGFDIEDADSFKAGLTAGCFNTWSPHVSYGHRFRNGISLSAYAGYMHSDGAYPFIIRNGDNTSHERRLNSDVNSVNTEFNMNVPAGKNGGSVKMKASLFLSRRGLPGAVILYCQNPTERLRDRNFSGGIRYNDSFAGGWKLETHTNYTNSWNRYTDSDPKYEVPLDNEYLQHEIGIGAIVGKRFGARWEIAIADDIYGNLLGSNIPECPYPARLTNMTSLSARYSYGKLNITGSVTGTYAREWLRENAGGRSASKPTGRLSPSLSASYSFLYDNSLRLRASVKDGFRMPTFNDLYYSRVGNASLVPEKALQTNIGLTWSRLPLSGKREFGFSLSADIYYNLVRDKITAIPAMFIWKMRNIGKVIMAGADVSAKLVWEMNSKVSLDASANYSYQYAVDITDPLAKNWKHQIPYTPEHSGNLAISAETFWITATYMLSCCSGRYSLPQNIQANLIRGYMDHGISIGRTFRVSGVALHASLQALNLSGDNYEIIKSYPMPGRQFRIGLKVTY